MKRESLLHYLSKERTRLTVMSKEMSVPRSCIRCLWLHHPKSLLLWASVPTPEILPNHQKHTPTSQYQRRGKRKAESTQYLFTIAALIHLNLGMLFLFNWKRALMISILLFCILFLHFCELTKICPITCFMDTNISNQKAFTFTR